MRKRATATAHHSLSSSLTDFSLVFLALMFALSVSHAENLTHILILQIEEKEGERQRLRKRRRTDGKRGNEVDVLRVEKKKKRQKRYAHCLRNTTFGANTSHTSNTGNTGNTGNTTNTTFLARSLLLEQLS